MSAWSTKRVNETNARHAKELFATLPFELPWYRFECRKRVAGDFSRCYTGAPWSQRLTVRCPPPVTGGVCLATRVRYRQSCGLDTWSALLAYLFVSRICVAGICFCFLLLFNFFPSSRIRSGEAFTSSVIFSSLSLLLFVFLFLCSDGVEKEACVCDHGFERWDLCAEIIIIIIITTMCDGVLHCLCFVFTVFLVSLHGDWCNKCTV